MSVSSWTLPSMPGLASPSMSTPSLVGMTIPSSMTGLPSMPSQSGLAPPNMTSPSGLAFPDVPPLPGSQAARVQEMLREDDPNSLNPFMTKPPPQGPTLRQRSCTHANRTRAGSNAYQTVIKCKDCGFVLHLEKKTVGKAMDTKEASACTHSRKNIRAPLQRLGSGAAWIAERRHQARRTLVKVELEQLRTGFSMILVPRSSH